MALAAGRSQVLAGPLSLHTQTAIHFASELTRCKIEVEDLDGGGLEAGLNMITCEGISHSRARAYK
jgi:RNA 3'-terminal phosphate cyclase (ATP)